MQVWDTDLGCSVSLLTWQHNQGNLWSPGHILLTLSRPPGPRNWPVHVCTLQDPGCVMRVSQPWSQLWVVKEQKWQ